MHSSIQKINFPYFRSDTEKNTPRAQKEVIFFGTDFYNLPIGSNLDQYIILTNKMLSYIRKHFSGFKLLYLPHPNEQEESKHLDLEGFELRQHTIGELYLYDNALSIEYVFSSCSWACGSAFAMGINSAVFLETMLGSVSEETIIGYRSYFYGLPECFFINSFEEPPQQRDPLPASFEIEGFAAIRSVAKDSKCIWILASDPALALRASIIIRRLKKDNSNLKAQLLMIRHRRWDLVRAYGSLFEVFDDMIKLPHRRVFYSARISQIINAFKVAHDIRKLDIREGDAIISFSHGAFEENCLLSYFQRTVSMQLMESRWYRFIYEEEGKLLNLRDYHSSIGVKFFNYFLEPVLGLYQTIYREYKDGKVINIFRYAKPLEKIYTKTFVLLPWLIMKK